MKNYVENRLAEYKVAQTMKERTGVDVPPPKIDTQKLARYAQCLVCGEMVDKQHLNLPRLCDECYTFSKYAVSQVGKGDQGMQHLFRSLELFQAYEQQRRQFIIKEDLERQPLQTPPGQPVGFEPTPEPEELHIKPEDVSAEDWARFKAMLKKSES